MIATFLIVFGVLLVCVVAMAVGVMAGRKPIKHCGSRIDANGNVLECAMCGNKSCKNNTKAESGSETDSKK